MQLGFKPNCISKKERSQYAPSKKDSSRKLGETHNGDEFIVKIETHVQAGE